MAINLTRREALRLASCGLASALPLDASALAASAESLGQLAEQAGILFGASVTGNIFHDASYRQLYLAQTRVLTSDLALKFLILRPDQGAPRYEEADRLVTFAQEQGLAFRGHTLIWNENNPDWLRKLKKDEIGALLDRHIAETVGRYRGKIHSWDVVNEPFWPDHGAPGGFRKGIWYDALGTGYIARAFKAAAAADPGARLVLNEAFTERGDDLGLKVRAGLLRLVADLLQAGVSLKAVGLECHLQPQYPSDDSGFVRFLEALERLGVDIYLTELDIDDAAYPDDPGQRDRLAAARVNGFLTHALSVGAVKVLECWQLADGYSWYADPSMLRLRKSAALPRPLPFDRALKPKPMFEAIASALSRRRA